MEILRSLALRAPIRRRPAALLHEWLELVDEQTSAEEPIARLEARIAELLGTEAAVFFPSGTMAQQAALRVHAERRGRWAFAAHPQSHLDNWELQGYNAVHGLRLHPAGDRNELLRTADLAAVAEPLAAVVWELPQRDLGGLLPEWAELGEQVALARAGGAAAHLDGARLWEAQTYYRRPLPEIAGLFDSVYVSLYKGIQGTRGAVLAGPQALVAEASVWRRRLGGAIPDAWPLALGPLAGLERLLPRMAEFREHAIALAAAVNADGVARAGEELIAERGVQVFLRVRSSPDPSRCSFEVSVGENALEFMPAEVAELVRDLVKRAG